MVLQCMHAVFLVWDVTLRLSHMTNGLFSLVCVHHAGVPCRMLTLPQASEPGTIRGDYCIEVGRNVIHGSDTVENAQKEIALWFGGGFQIRQPTCLQANSQHRMDEVFLVVVEPVDVSVCSANLCLIASDTVLRIDELKYLAP